MDRNFEDAVASFSSFQDLTDVDRFYYGLSLLASGNLKSAMSNFALVAQGNSDYVQQATWYLGLAHLKQGTSDEAIVHFKHIVDKGYYHASKAREILRRIDE